jgi:hypothetical protein
MKDRKINTMLLEKMIIDMQKIIRVIKLKTTLLRDI